MFESRTGKSSMTRLFTGFKEFVGTQRVGLMKPGQQRFYLHTSALPPAALAVSRGHEHRACIEEADGSTRLEMCGGKKAWSLHMVVDMGSNSWPKLYALYDVTRGAVSGTFEPDPPHRRHRHTFNAFAKAEIEYAQGETHSLLTVCLAPHGGSGFWRVLQCGADEQGLV